MSDLASAVAALETVARDAGLPTDQARAEALAFAAAIAESAPRAASDWVRSAGMPDASLDAATRAFFDAATLGRRWRQAPTALLSRLVAEGSSRAPAYAAALTEVASAACSLGELTLRVTGNAAVAAAAQLGAIPPTPERPTPTRGDLPTGADPVGSTGADAAQTQTAGQTAAQPAAPALPPARPLAELLAELDALVGLARVKREIHRQVALLSVEQKRTAAGLKPATITRHLVFVGNPGTGKTTVARMVAGIYRALGLLSTGQLVEVDRSELVAGYLGQTAMKTAEVCAKAAGGVLFIDEAYGLTGDQYGEEAVNTLVKEMEDRRDDLVLIVAGYPVPMAGFIAANPGLASRFTTVIEFEDYSDDELVEILQGLAAKSDFVLAEAAVTRVREILAATPRGESFGNGRFVRTLFEQAVGRHAWRLRDVAEPTREQLCELVMADFDDHEDEPPPAPEPAPSDDVEPEPAPSDDVEPEIVSEPEPVPPAEEPR